MWINQIKSLQNINLVKMDHYQNCLYFVQNLIKEFLKQMLKIVPSYNRRHDTVGKPAERIIYLCTE